MFGEAEEGLDPRSDGRPGLGLIVDSVAASGRSDELCRDKAVQALARLPAEQGLERRAEFAAGYVAETALAREKRRQPFIEPFHEGVVAEVGQAVVAHACEQKSTAQRFSAVAPRQQGKAVAAHA